MTLVALVSFAPANAELVSKVMLYGSSIPAAVAGEQPVALKAELNYDSTVPNAPIAVIMHSFSGITGNFDTYRHNAQSLRSRGFFTIMPAMRGREDSDGARDFGGLEIHDIYDAVEAVKARYPQLVDGNHIYITGYSGGGGNVMSSLTKFPDYWNAAASFFGIADYGFDTVNGWYQKGAGSAHKAMLDTGVGNPTLTPANSAVIDRYHARASNLASKNNPYAEIHLFVNNDETLCPPVHHLSYRNNAIVAASHTGQFNNIAHHVGVNGAYVDFNGNGSNSADELQRWPHHTLTLNEQAAGEQWFIGRMANKQIPTPVLLASDELYVAGFVKTRPFALYLGDGQNAAGSLSYMRSATTMTFTLNVLSSVTTVPTFLQIDATGHLGKFVDIYRNGALVESMAGGGIIGTHALQHGTTVTIEFTHRKAPTPPILPKPAPIAHWRFEPGAFLTSSSSESFPLTVSATVTQANAVSHDMPASIPSMGAPNTGALGLTGTGHVSAGSNLALQPAAFTFEALVVRDAGATNARYIGSRYTSSTGQRSWALGVASGTQPTGVASGELFLTVGLEGLNPVTVGSGITVQAGKPYYVGFSFEPSHPITFHVKNLETEADLATVRIPSPVIELPTHSVPLLIGAVSEGSNRWSGVIDEVRISAGALIESHLLVSSGLRYQDWRNRFFTPEEQADAGVSGPTADPDGDNAENLLEFGAGSYPSSRDEPLFALTATTTHFDLRVSSVVSPDIVSIAWTSTDLQNWEPLDDAYVIEDAVTDFVRVKTYAVPLSGPRRFFRTTHSLVVE